MPEDPCHHARGTATHASQVWEAAEHPARWTNGSGHTHAGEPRAEQLPAAWTDQSRPEQGGSRRGRSDSTKRPEQENPQGQEEIGWPGRGTGRHGDREARGVLSSTVGSSTRPSLASLTAPPSSGLACVTGTTWGHCELFFLSLCSLSPCTWGP